MDLVYFLKVLYRKKWIILGLSVLAVIVAFLFLVNKNPLYTSVAQYSTGFTSEKVKLVDGTAAIELYAVDVKFDNVIETIKSPQVLSRISYMLLLHDLTDSSTAYKKLSDKEKKNSLLKQISTDTIRYILADKLSKNTLLQPDKNTEYLILEYLKMYNYDYFSLLANMTVSRVARTDYLDITYSSENPNLSATVVNSIGEEFLNYYKNLNLSRTSENASNIKELLQSQQNKVDSLGRELLAEKVSQGTIDPVSRTTSAMETVTELESRLADERGKYNGHLNRYNYLTARLKTLQTSSSSGGSNDEVVRLINQRNDLVAELARKGGNDPALEKRISDLRTEINQKSTAGTSKASARTAIDELTREISEENALMNASKSTIEDYESRIRRYMGMTNINPGSSIKMEVIQTKLDMENEQLSDIKQKYSQIQGLAKDDPTSNFIQTRIGQPAAEPNTKKTLVKMALSGISVFFLSAVIFIFLEIFDSSVKTPGIFTKLTKQKVANVINRTNLKKRNASDVVIEDLEPKKFISENIFKNNIRKLRYELLKTGQKTFLFTSTQNKAGKSTIIEALAASLLLSKKKVLIIDFNFSNNSLTRFFETDVLLQDIIQKFNYKVPFSEQKVVGITKYEGLHIIGCREGNTTPSEVLFNVDINALFEHIKNSYDFVLIEGASLNKFADSKELAEYADRIFGVFAADASVHQVDMESLKFITELKEKNQGIILNKVLPENINS